MQLMKESFLIYNASAGAGKTYQLVRNYLKLCLKSKDPMQFMHILAITFTNKAAREMKNRLLAQLRLLENYPELDTDDKKYAEELAHELGIEVLDLKYRAEKSLSAILHHYAAFSVSTIDSFTNRLIRSFSKDLDLNGNFQIEVDNERILEEAIDRLFDELEADHPYTEILSRYIQQQLEDEYSSNTRSLLKDKGMELFSERAFPYLEALKKLSAEHILEAEGHLRKRQKAIKKELNRLCDGFFEASEAEGLVGSDFRTGGVYSLCTKIKKGDFKPHTKAINDTYNEKGPSHIPSAKGKKGSSLSSEESQERFYRIGLEIKTYLDSNIEELFILDLLLKSIHGLALLGALEIRIDEIKKESGRLPIGDFNKIISRELQAQPAPFLYERLGDRYRDFFIDEFQDTSRLQWENMLPLINNALAGEDSSTMIVGDAKQSIYRFRGGDLQLFVDLFNDSDPSNKVNGQELYRRKVVNMGSNYRSHADLVNFNNQFFEAISANLPNEQYREIYARGTQKPARESGGFLSLEILADKPDKEDYFEALLERLNELFARGYQQKDLCILTRSNAKGKEAATYLLEMEARLKIPNGEALQILSADSLVVGASAEVRALISFLQMSEKPDQMEIRKDWLAFVADDDSEQAEAHLRRKKLAKLKLAELDQELAGFNYQNWKAADLLEKCYQLMQCLGMNWQEDPYLQFFLDQVREYQSNHRPVSAEFLEWWLDRGQDKSVGIPQETNAIQIMSVHKSKGLEFPVVIYLFAEGALDSMGGGFKKSTGWVNLDSEKYLLPFSLIDFKQASLPEYQPIYSSWYNEELSLRMMDEMNVYYVAFTRAVKELHIVSQLPPKSLNNKTYIQDFLARHFEAQGPGIYHLGEAKQQENHQESYNTFKLRSFEVLPWREKLQTISNAPRHWQQDKLQEARWGSKMHELLARLKSSEDLKQVLKIAQSEAWIEKEDINQLENQLQALFEHPQAGILFKPDSEVYNERSLLIPGQERKIPDRLVLNDGQWYLADYKTGAELAAHEEQLNEYCNLLAQSGIAVEAAYLIYLHDEIKVDQIA